MKRLFVAYAKEDIVFANQFIYDLRTHGLPVHDSPTGAVVIVIASPAAMRSPQVQDQLQGAQRVLYVVARALDPGQQRGDCYWIDARRHRTRSVEQAVKWINGAGTVRHGKLPSTGLLTDLARRITVGMGQLVARALLLLGVLLFVGGGLGLIIGVKPFVEATPVDLLDQVVDADPVMLETMRGLMVMTWAMLALVAIASYATAVAAHPAGSTRRLSFSRSSATNPGDHRAGGAGGGALCAGRRAGSDSPHPPSPVAWLGGEQ